MENKRQAARSSQWNVSVNNWVCGLIDAVALITSKTLQPRSVCPDVPTLSIEVSAGIDSGESREPSRLLDRRGRPLLRKRLIGKRFVSILACGGGTHMDADDLRIVDAVARIGSMNRAAAELNMVQSNVTARIRLLEEELGVQLFVRHSRGVEPSDLR
jgi:hypothetical protein